MENLLREYYDKLKYNANFLPKLRIYYLKDDLV